MMVTIFQLREKQESDAVERIFCAGRSDPLLVGSVKSYCGHTEGVAPYISLLKCLLALDTGYIAPNMHFNKPNLELSQLKNGKFKVSFQKPENEIIQVMHSLRSLYAQVVTQKTRLPGRMVGINALSFFGVTSHAVIEQHSK